MAGLAHLRARAAAGSLIGKRGSVDRDPEARPSRAIGAARSRATTGASRVAVVGAGWAGLAAALVLAEVGVAVTILDAAPAPGGRARTVTLQTPLGSLRIDNGQHLVVGAYHEALALIGRLGAAERLRRDPLSLTAPSGLSLRAARLPAPLHLAWAMATARGLGAGARIAMLRLMLGLRRSGWRARPGETVSALLARHGQPAPLVERLWAPLCIGALNTLPDAACATAFAAVLRDTLGADRASSDFVTGDVPLGSLLPEPAVERLLALGADVRPRQPVRRIARDREGWWLDCGGSGASRNALPSRFEQVLLALPPWSATRLLEASGLAPGPVAGFEPEPIATAWALWRAEAAPALPRWSLLDENAALLRHGQWLFDRGVVATDQQRVRLAGIVISAASRLDTLAPEAVARGLSAQLTDAFGGPPPDALKLVTDRRATFRCTPDRPQVASDHFRDQAPGLWLAGDWLWPDYPATLESAVRSGQLAGRRIVEYLAG